MLQCLEMVGTLTEVDDRCNCGIEEEFQCTWVPKLKVLREIKYSIEVKGLSKV